MSRSTLVAILLVLVPAAALAAGCVTPKPAIDPASASIAAAGVDWGKKAMPFGEGHDHRNYSQHVGLSSPNFQELAWDPLATNAYNNKTAGSYFCGGQGETKEKRKISVISSYDSDVAFVLVDVTDPTMPTKIGEYVLKGTTHYDVDITPDADFVVIGSDPNLNPTPPPGASLLPTADVPVPTGTMPVQPMFRDACTGIERPVGPESQLPIAPAVLLISIKDPKNPQFVDAQPAPVLGPHSVSTGKIGDVTYVAASITNLAHHASYFQFFQIQPSPNGGKLVLVSVVDSGLFGKNVLAPDANIVRDEVSNGHVDAEIAIHPVTKKPVVYLSDWDGGLIILDFSNPAAPLPLSSWADTGPDAGAVHSTRSMTETWDGHHYVLVGQEFVHRPVNRPSGWMYVIDDTDPTKPKEVGRWVLPYDTEAKWAPQGGLETYSTHYFRVVNRTVFMSMYHIGVWAIDLSTDANLKEPKTVGVFVPDKAPPAPRRNPVGGYDLTPFVLDVYPNPDYTMTIFDGYSGVYSVKYDVAHPMPAPTPWPATGKQHEGS